MNTWLEHKEKVLRHQSYLEWHLGSDAVATQDGSSMAFNGDLTPTKWPSRNTVELEEIFDHYAAVFPRGIASYLVRSRHSGPQLTPNQLERIILYTDLPFNAFPILHKLRLTKPADSTHSKCLMVNTIYAQPERQSNKGLVTPAQSDTVLVNLGSGGKTGVEGAARFAPIFTSYSKSLCGAGSDDFFISRKFGPGAGRATCLCRMVFKIHLPGGDHRMHKMKRSMQDCQWVASVIPISSIRRSTDLYLKLSSAQ